MKRIYLNHSWCLFLVYLWLPSLAWGQFEDKSSDLNALPKVPPEFEVTLFASEPMVRQPCSMAFDERGRIFVGMGPQYRNPTPETPGDSVVIVLDTDGDGLADQTKEFATGFNAIQGLSWHGRDLWVANAPDLTMVRDLDGDDQADEYVKVYTDLGNLEHGLHGLSWAPDGKLYMSKGNSKGLNQPGRYAPKAFRDLWGLKAPADVPDIPASVTSGKNDYRRAYHDPADDWGLDGGVLRCDDGGKNLEIVARGFRNPWDITFDSGFNWIGTDNDQTTGDRVFMPFFGAHFGWNHAWSSHWGIDPHGPTAPVSGPLFEGSGTGVVFCQSPQFPPKYRGAFLVNDWLLKTTYLWRPQWDGAMLRPAGGGFTPFIEGGSSLFRPTDMEFGPDGALWVLGWSSGYGAEWKDGQLTNEGRIFRIAWKDAPPADKPEVVDFARSPAGERNSGESHYGRLEPFSIVDLINEFDSPLPVRRINAQDELVRRGDAVQQQLVERLNDGKLTENQETWTVWALGRMPNAASLAGFLHDALQAESKASLNLQIQAVRIFAYRAKQFGQTERLTDCVRVAIRHPQPRMRFAAVQAVHETRQTVLVPELLEQLLSETDQTIFYAGWQALRALSSMTELRELLSDSRAAIRRAALLALAETHSVTQSDVRTLAQRETDAEVHKVAELWLAKSGKNRPRIEGRSLQVASAAAITEEKHRPGPIGIATVQNLKVKNRAAYQVVPGGFSLGTLAYVDRSYRLSNVPQELEGADLIQTANNDDSSRGEQWLNADAIVPVRVWVGIDVRQKTPPSWLLKNFQKVPLTVAIDEGAKFNFYERMFDAGPIELGGNTDDGRSGGKGNYIIAIAPLPLAKQPTKATLDASLALLEHGDRDRGELLFHRSQGASCGKCHSLDHAKNGFGPNLSSIGLRSNAQHIVQSIVEPNAVITEGFNQMTVVTDEGNVFSGVLLEESGLTLSLGQTNGERVDIPKTAIEERRTSRVSAMPEMAENLTPQQVADLATFLLSKRTPLAVTSANATAPSSNPSTATGFGVEEHNDRLRISLGGQHIVDFVFRDEKILRPYFANARLTSGVQVTRHHPPIKDVDAVDHDTMHPGIWLGIGDISGQDFWRNKATMEHVRFVTAPTTSDGQLRFATECRLKTNRGEPLCLLTNDFTLTARPNGWLLVWSAEFRADQRSIVFGDQEEMGFGARVATPFTEKNGGLIRSSTGKQTAKATWGQPATWCDYSGSVPQSGGITLMASDKNFRESWWHNRDYGVFVANPFGREAMKQGPRSIVTVAKGETLRLTFGALIHDQRELDPQFEFDAFEKITLAKSNVSDTEKFEP
jgi:putative membrane-bound dehydrogenase-like protein